MEPRTAIPRVPRPHLPPPLLPTSERHHRPRRATRLALLEARDRSAPAHPLATAFFQPRATPHIVLPCVSPASRDRSWNPWTDACASRHRRRVRDVALAPPLFPPNTAPPPPS